MGAKLWERYTQKSISLILLQVLGDFNTSFYIPHNNAVRTEWNDIYIYNPQNGCPCIVETRDTQGCALDGDRLRFVQGRTQGTIINDNYKAQ